MARDYYEILGVDRNASQEEIKKAYHKLAHQYHPDKGRGDDAKFKEVNEAYQVLGNAKKRQQYDQFGSAFGAGQAGSGGFSWQDFARTTGGANPFGQAGIEFDFGDIFGDLFGDFFTSRARQRNSIAMDLEIDFKDVVFGAEKTITLPNQEKLTITVPPGVSEGQMLRVPGRGNVDRSGVAGDIYLQLHVKPHPTITREGFDLVSRETISFPDAALGTKITVETIDGTAEIKVPAGVLSGQRLRLKGRGIVRGRGGSRGDHYVEMTVRTPQKLSRKQKKLYEELRDSA